MQKDLFIKFIPESIGYSEIKVNDYIKPYNIVEKVKRIFNTHINGYESLAFETYAGNKYVSAQVNAIYRPFLCTNNIQIGDKCKYNSVERDKVRAKYNLEFDHYNDDHIIENLNHSDYKPYEVKTNHGFGPKENYFKIIGGLTTENIEEGDTVVIEFTDGVIPTGEYLMGVLTKKWEDDPYCQIDGKNIDLASEGHSSNIFKVNENLSFN